MHSDLNSKMSATRLQQGPNFLPLCICWQVWALLALSNKLDSGYFPNCLLRKVLAHPRVCSWLWLMGKLLRIIVLQKDVLPANAAASMLLHVHPACVAERKRHTKGEKKRVLFLWLCVRICVQSVFTSSTTLLLEHWKARAYLFVVLQVKVFFCLDSSTNMLLFLLWSSIHYKM